MAGFANCSSCPAICKCEFTVQKRKGWVEGYFTCHTNPNKPKPTKTNQNKPSMATIVEREDFDPEELCKVQAQRERVGGRKDA